MSDERPNRRDFLRIFGGAATGKRKPVPAGPRSRPWRAPVAVPLEGDSAVVDLAHHPLPPGRDLLVVAGGRPGPILVGRPSADHFAAVGGDCPHCGEELHWDPMEDVAACPGGGGSWRLDGMPRDGPRDRRVPSFVVRRAGPRLEIDLRSPPDR